MFYHYLSAAIRNLRRYKLHTLISLLCLALGLTAAFLIGLYVKDELTYERWIPNNENIFRVDIIDLYQGGRYGAGPADLRGWIAQDFPERVETARTAINRRSVSFEDREFYELITWADQNFFDVFELEVVSGSLSDAIAQPNGIVISRNIAQKYFGDVDPVGKTLTFNRRDLMRINAVIEDAPSNTHLVLDLIAPSHAPSSFLAAMDQTPLSGLGSLSDTLWATQTYVKRLDSQSSVEGLEVGFNDMLDRRGPRNNDGQPTSDSYLIDLISLADIHLTPINTDQSGKDLSQIYILLSIAFLILFSASSNYIILMTTMGRKRAKEIAVRKSLGANSTDVFCQFMMESLLYVAISCVIATLITALLVVPVNTFLDKSIQFQLLSDKVLIISLIITALFTTIIAGFYPSVVLSKYTPIAAFKTASYRKDSSISRKGLITIQFTILTGLVISTVTIFGQARFAIEESITTDTNPIINIVSSCNPVLTESLLQLNDVLGVACSAVVPQLGINYDTTIARVGSQDQDSRILYTALDAGFFELYDLEVVAGRAFEKNRTSDFSPATNEWNTPESIVINETAARRLGFESPDMAVGNVLEWTRFYSPESPAPEHEAVIIGVIEDFQIGSVRDGIQPAAFFADPNWTRQVSVKIRGTRVLQTLAEIDEIWGNLDNRGPIARSFYNASIESMYQSTVRQAQLVASYSAVAFFISILGLISLTTFEAQKRTKEIGIRKVLGGARTNIVLMLMWDFFKPALLSVLFAWPITYYILARWLSGYQRHVEIGFWTFISPTSVILAISLAFLAAYAYRAASVNPTMLLRHE